MAISLRYSLFLLLIALGACSRGNRDLDAPKSVSPPAASKALSSSLFDVGEEASFRLERVVIALKRGDIMAHYPTRFRSQGKNFRCNRHIHPNFATMEWESGRSELGGWSTEFGEIFYDAMKSRGANVVGDPTKLFGATSSAKRPEYLVGGRITRISGNICHIYGFWRGRKVGENLAEFRLNVEWELFSSLTRRVVYRFATEGYAKTSYPSANVVAKTLRNAFANAVEVAAGVEGFRRSLSKANEQNVTPPTPEKRLVLTGRAPFKKPITERVGSVQAAGVTIETSAGHGSGFLITRDGYILTNEHVVGEAERVTVAFRNGLRVPGQVLRVARRRDTALVKIPIVATNILPILPNRPLRVLDPVYALGTPTDRALHSTLTKGVVSAYRKFEEGRLIQADVAISRGNSGGPLLDKNGNVVGISVSAFTEGQNLNLFIPIDDALKALNLNIRVK